MPIAPTVKTYLAKNQAAFAVVPHRHSACSLNSANTAHIKAGRLAKAVLLSDDPERSHFIMALVPATHRVELDRLAQRVGRPVQLATERDAAGIFADCETGAIPALGPAYGVQTVVDDALMEEPEVYFEAGDHEHLVHMETQAFAGLLADCTRGRFSRLM